ncbi:hypothetical protein PIB30_119200 [Stylosanthes scabra]|uniref:Uncharacterized protein n=1 Tax=Stylosanthes scabra TaxID=79078 RepID=A0ABU6TRD6_9FABA|nr:hypothetical protein [Stylosanthes scabra]
MDRSDEETDRQSTENRNTLSKKMKKQVEKVSVKSRRGQSKSCNDNRTNKSTAPTSRNTSRVNFENTKEDKLGNDPRSIKRPRIQKKDVEESEELMKEDHKEANRDLGTYATMAYTDLLATAHGYKKFQYMNDLPKYPHVHGYQIPPYQSHHNVPTYFHYWNASGKDSEK